MAKQKEISAPLIGMNRNTGGHSLSEQQFAMQLNGRADTDEPYALTDEHSNILASKYKDGFKFIGGRNHVVRDKTYIFLVNPTTGVSEIGCIANNRNFNSTTDNLVLGNCDGCNETLLQNTPLQEQEQVPHQTYETILDDSCNLCLGFDVDHPIIDIIIKEENIGTTLWWTSTPGKKELRYLELDNLSQYKEDGTDNCGEVPETTCLDCDKIRVFKLYRDLKSKSYQRTIGGNLKKGSYEILGAYCDQLGNEFTTYTPLTSVIPIFDEANIIHEQEDNNAETNFSIKIELESPDTVYDFYKIAVRYYTSLGVFSSFEEGIHSTSDKIVILSDNNGQSIDNNAISLKKPFVESVDGMTASNNILILNGVREREPVNLQPVMSLAGLAIKWMSFRAKESLYANADSYRYLGYNRDENQIFSIDFGFKSGYRTNPFIFIPRPSTQDEMSDFTQQGDDYDSIVSAIGNCDGTIRNKKWQFYNTATEIGVCSADTGVETSTQQETVITYTTVDVPSVPSGTLDIDLTAVDAFIGLKPLIEDNLGDSFQLGSIAPYVDIDNLTFFTNVPESDCDSPFIPEDNPTIVVGEILAENIQFVYPPDSSGYATVSPPQSVSIYEINEDRSKLDYDFSFTYNASTGFIGAVVDSNSIIPLSRKRVESNYNRTCRQADALQRISDRSPQNAFGVYYHNDYGGETLGDLQEDNVTMPVVQGAVNSIDGIFTNRLHKNALWFRTQIFDRDKFYINISENTSCKFETIRINNNNVRYGGNITSLVRVSIFNRCSDTAPLHSEIIDISSPTFITVDQGILDQVQGDIIYVSVETSIRESRGLGPNWQSNDWVDESDPNNPQLQNGATFRTTYIANLPCGAWNIVDRDEEAERATITWEQIQLKKSQKYSATCQFEVPVLQNCEPVPYKYGEMGYYESTDDYPDNNELYNSSTLVIKKDNITNADFREKLRVYQEGETSDSIILSDKADFRCQKIRAYKMPDNKTSPFIRTENIASNSESVISPLGIIIDGEVISNLLDVAVDNNLITTEQREEIINYKIYRADATLDRSVVSSGLVFNTKSYEVEGEKINYFNYPFNSLGKDKYFPNSKDGEFDKFQVISPELDYFKPSLPNEMSLQGFMYGKSNSRVLPVEDHSKMVILGRKAKRLASTLATIEAAAELLIQYYQGAEVYRVQFGLANSANPVGIGLGISVAAIGLVTGIVSKVGQYRLEWIRSFENLGTPYNFGHYIAAGSNYNYLKTDQQDNDRLRGLTIGKYLKSGMLNVSDSTSGNIIKLNNIDREEAAFFSMGNYPIENIDQRYFNFDNSDQNPNFSSQILSSEIGCHSGKSPEVSRNIASPYVAFKNYIPNQYGTVDSIKWVDTNYCIPITESGICNGILGGDTFISRHSKKRKARLFETDLLGSADLIPFPYKINSNYGEPRYYVDYKTNGETRTGSQIFPDVLYDAQFDCNNSSNTFYVEPPAKFYLYNIAFVNFLCETRINTNFRNARKEPWDQFYPQNTDYEAITQPTTVSLTRPEDFFYNKAYLQSATQNSVFVLPEYYSKENEAKKAYNINSGIYSLPDVNENSITEPWLMYRPNDKFTFTSQYGNLVNMKGIESDQILMYFENALQLQNSVNQFTDGSTQYNSELGNGGIFAKRALTLKTTDIGYGGTQSKQTLSCEFGHFHADMKRGQVFNYMGGNNMEEISRYSNGKPNGMDIWFKEHLPLKFSKYFPEYGLNDNPYNGLGIHWGFDSKYRRVILTKKDYIPTSLGKENLSTDSTGIYDTDLSNYQDLIGQYELDGFAFLGIESNSLKFEKSNTTITEATDIYAFFDTTSMQQTDAVFASDALKIWFQAYQNENPGFNGRLYILPYGNEAYLDYSNRIKNGNIVTTTSGSWGTIAQLPDNLNTQLWEPPTDVILLAFVDESNVQYHGSTVNGGFSSQGIIQPTSEYFQTYQRFLENYTDDFNFFRAVLYPIVQSTTGLGGALVLQALAAIEGRTLTQSDIDATNTTVNVSILLTENPYENAIIPGTTETLLPLKELGWIGQYDKVTPASEVFNSEQFQMDLDNLVINGGQITDNEIVFEPLNKVSLTNMDYFKDVSWTITYKPETGSWESYMSYTPDYYINHTDYFQSGVNTEGGKFGLWSHLLDNKSYRVFYGQKYPYIIEYPVKNQYLSKRLESINWNAQLRRHHNDYDYAAIEENPFTAVTIYNNYENSGRLIPVINNGTISQSSKYPINKGNTQEVLVSYDNYRYNLNYFYNRTKSNTNNQPQWIWDENQIGKTINDKAVSFIGKSTLERLKGNFFMVRLERDGNTNLDLDFRWSEQTTNPIR